MRTQNNRVNIARVFALALFTLVMVGPLSVEAGRGHHRQHRHHHHGHHVYDYGNYGGYGHYAMPRYNNHRYIEHRYYSQPYTYYAPAYSNYYYEGVPGNFYLGINSGNGYFMLGY